MDFRLHQAVEILERTPRVLHALLHGLSDDWVMRNEGPDTWSAYDIVGHLIHGERTDWIARMEIILGDGDKRFTPFDRLAQFHESKGKSLEQLLTEFGDVRNHNLAILRSKNIDETALRRTGIHPAFGEVTLEQLLAQWAAHDLSHIAQIARVVAKQYKPNIGPWIEYMRLLQS
jgi:hypothetical protein